MQKPLIDEIKSLIDFGAKKYPIPYKAGNVQEVATEYYANGDVYAEIPFANGNREGVEKKYFINIFLFFN